ncbi:3-phosphoserine/phosphohydroxythreonine transaminase [Paenibacillus sp. GCM10023248]|uniref:3-phosphoserine/phosphohydroxythreonine transaminase n=1 Tax=Bacillales TaxID=1385 RepID=UPI002379AF5A|nr:MULTISPECIES: 3-phosphoserine/phosphohydroxythreonine transaminase [Bacillales]MDD9269783.1 3-phosphoserine/phosphohydroxythreonine transaminase [Paenibacillus sp. MAHUQ-63]MDR6881805.1 phosphoserine aminotransferase [Bacillus sp. 3255]
MSTRKYNFNPGPAALPLEVLEEAQERFVDHERQGISLLEMSHRSRTVEELSEETRNLLRTLLALPDSYEVLFMGGGASTQFALLPMNFLAPGQTANYVLTGSFAEKAYKEAGYIGHTHIAASTKEQGWRTVPAVGKDDLRGDPAYLHITMNNTIEGSCFTQIPDTGGTPLVADVTSEILSRRLDLEKFDLMYAGAQKNLGPAGVTAVIVRDAWLETASARIPEIMRYSTFAANKSLFNTPPVHAIYMMNLVLKWTHQQGGVEQIERHNQRKSQLVYDAIDRSDGFYQGVIEAEYRSSMNMTWRMATEELERAFIAESVLAGFEGLAGHRSVGGLRASAYNAVTYEACLALAEFMNDFARRHG